MRYAICSHQDLSNESLYIEKRYYECKSKICSNFQLHREKHSKIYTEAYIYGGFYLSPISIIVSTNSKLHYLWIIIVKQPIQGPSKIHIRLDTLFFIARPFVTLSRVNEEDNNDLWNKTLSTDISILALGS